LPLDELLLEAFGLGSTVVYSLVGVNRMGEFRGRVQVYAQVDGLANFFELTKFANS